MKEYESLPNLTKVEVTLKYEYPHIYILRILLTTLTNVSTYEVNSDYQRIDNFTRALKLAQKALDRGGNHLAIPLTGADLIQFNMPQLKAILAAINTAKSRIHRELGYAPKKARIAHPTVRRMFKDGY